MEQASTNYFYVASVLIGFVVGANLIVLTDERFRRLKVWAHVLAPVLLLYIRPYVVNTPANPRYLVSGIAVVMTVAAVVKFTAFLCLKLASRYSSKWTSVLLLWPALLRKSAYGYSKLIGDPYSRYSDPIHAGVQIVAAVSSTAIGLLLMISAGHVVQIAFGPYQPTSGLPGFIGTPTLTDATATVEPTATIEPIPTTESESVETSTAESIPPGPPAQVAASATGIDQITLTFTPPIEDGGLPVVGYRVLTSPTGDLFFVDRSVDGDVFVVSGLEQGIFYQFQVRAINQAGIGSQSTLSNTVVIPES